MSKLIYLAGPYRAETPWQVEQNIRVAERWFKVLSQKGVFCLCPHTMTRFMDGLCPDDFYLDLTMECMRRCDAVFAFDPMSKSEGTGKEVVEMRAINRPVFSCVDDVLEFAGVKP